MNDKTTPPSNPAETVVSAAAGLTRRRLVRAGLTAAPVMAALQSNTVLAGGSKGFGHGCIRPSTFSSLKAANWTISQGRDIKGNFVCRPYSHWKNNFPHKFKNVYFLSEVTKCNRDPRPYDNRKTYKKLKMRDVFELRDDDTDARLARYVLAAFLSADAAGAGSDNVWLTKRQCHEIWNGRGNWKPFAGATWDLNQTMNYFEVIFARG
ncbi:hypothetical protein [Hydrogenophaga sp.]|uniref:hypothetical protein n=1 Tax=Hydrogenophaga sp. TaxID=1904254 RepID=UPI0027186899|nr:hypothetical protein [Hydrogenophaga sp.]MDO9505013.1 hypothetical protein [Hydrogenophaga sp.]